MKAIGSYGWLLALGMVLAGCLSCSDGGPTASPGLRIRIVGYLRTNRLDFASASLGNGRILVAGGVGNGGVLLSSAEVFDLKAGRSEYTPCSLQMGRRGAVGASLPGGRAIVIGGGPTNAQTALVTEVFDAATGCFTPGPSLVAQRGATEGARTQADSSVLVFEGLPLDSADSTGGAEVLSANASAFQAIDRDLGAQRDLMTTVELQDESTLLTGGEEVMNGQLVNSAQAVRYDPSTRKFRQILPGLTETRLFHTASTLPNGVVVILGGLVGGRGPTGDCETFDPATETFSSVGACLLEGRVLASAFTLSNGKILVLGGLTQFGQVPTRRTIVVDPASWRLRARPYNGSRARPAPRDQRWT
jgi:hypothetical protein